MFSGPAVIVIASLFISTGMEGDFPPLDSLSQSGEVALDHWPWCDFFVIHTKRGFSLVNWRSGAMFGEGDMIFGPADHTGLRTLLIDGLIIGEVSVTIEEVEVSLSKAQAAFYKRCDLK